MATLIKGDALSTGSVTTLYAHARGGDQDAACLLIQRLSPIVHAYCRRRFGQYASATQSGADFANEAMVSFHELLAQAKLQLVFNRKNLLAYVIGIAWKKRLQHQRKELTEKRGAGAVVQVSALAVQDAAEYAQTTAFLEPETLDAHCRELLDALPEDLCLIAIRRLQGYALRDIANELDCHASTVKRKISIIRKKWNEVLG